MYDNHVGSGRRRGVPPSKSYDPSDSVSIGTATPVKVDWEPSIECVTRCRYCGAYSKRQVRLSSLTTDAEEFQCHDRGCGGCGEETPHDICQGISGRTARVEVECVECDYSTTFWRHPRDFPDTDEYHTHTGWVPNYTIRTTFDGDVTMSISPRQDTYTPGIRITEWVWTFEIDETTTKWAALQAQREAAKEIKNSSMGSEIFDTLGMSLK